MLKPYPFLIWVNHNNSPTRNRTSSLDNSRTPTMIPGFGHDIRSLEPSSISCILLVNPTNLRSPHRHPFPRLPGYRAATRQHLAEDPALRFHAQRERCHVDQHDVLHLAGRWTCLKTYGEIIWTSAGVNFAYTLKKHMYYILWYDIDKLYDILGCI